MFKCNPCVYEACNHYPHYLRIYFDDHRYSTYAYRAVYCTLLSISSFFRRKGANDSIIEGYKVLISMTFLSQYFLFPLAIILKRLGSLISLKSISKSR